MTYKEYFTREEFVNMVEAYNKAEKERQILIRQIAELKAENDRLREEVETRDNLIDHFRDEALYRATIASEYQKDRTKLEQTLQEIKKIADARCDECKYGKDGISCKYGDCGEAKLHLITQLITKAEEE